MKFIEEYVMYIEKHVFIKKDFYKLVKHGFANLNLSRKDS